jgi:predicted N-acyltransferase
MMRIEIFTSIHDIEPQLWDSIVLPGEIFHHWQFLQITEDAKVEDALFWYLLIYDGEKLVANTVLSAFSFSLSLFMSDVPWVSQLNKRFPRLFNIRMLFCGLPASFGQLNLAIADEKYAGAICSLITGEMQRLAKKLSIPFLCVKELRPTEIQRFAAFEKEGFFLANSIPYMQLHLRWKNFAGYLQSLRHGYRRRILLSLKKIGVSLPTIISREAYDASNGKPTLVLSAPDETFATSFYHDYLKVMERTPTKLETLNLAFFKTLFAHNKNYLLLQLVHQNKVVSSALLHIHHGTLTFMLVARAHAKDPLDSYANLVYGIMELAFRNGCNKIAMGQTAYHLKQRIGCTPEQAYIWFASRRPLTHWILKRFRNLVFPTTPLETMHVFREQDSLVSRVANNHYSETH